MKIFRRKSQAVGKANTPPPKSEAKTLLQDDTHAIFVMHEHERRRTDLGWSYRNLEAGDPKRYGTATGDWQSETFQDPVHLLPVGWQFRGKWSVILCTAPPYVFFFLFFDCFTASMPDTL